MCTIRQISMNPNTYALHENDTESDHVTQVIKNKDSNCRNPFNILPSNLANPCTQLFNSNLNLKTLTFKP
ncbi:hypothetical protein GNI_022340 [Gregarina niphandrodes]|uniref:Uncharacterized protein n=1 Tax=Gregarina niphandrodes TaxID=110365 RepID=A0A023BBW4_GRENI|nr:hypothetical protein GNI_022340 [Gregarina niphandrodes]EZG80161.1 hypothetical protein GNI_022340 [Gregarina niphandrodes]|eukprot:XP_011134318.1 hypothetical protein GNI_022340 [Gregarina niphandrodes]